MNAKHIVLLKSRASNSGGLEKYASRIASSFAERGAKVSILTTGGPSLPPSTSPSIAFYPVRTVPWPGFLRMEQFDRYVQSWLQRCPASLIFGMDRNRFQTHIRAGNGVHIAYLKSRVFTEGRFKHWICQLNPMHRKILELEKAAFEHPRLCKLFANSHMVREELLEHYQIDPKKIVVIHNGVEWGEMESDYSAWEEKKQEGCLALRFQPEHFHFLFIGNGYLRKGLDKLLEGLAHLPTREFHLSVIGKDNRMDQYVARATQWGIEKNVTFFGPRPDIRLFYQIADALVIPSFYDPFANVTVEALAMGLFVVSSKHNGGHEVLTPEHGVVIEDLLSRDAMVAALQKTLQHRKNRISAEQARKSVAHLDFSEQLRKLIEACE